MLTNLSVYTLHPRDESVSAPTLDVINALVKCDADVHVIETPSSRGCSASLLYIAEARDRCARSLTRDYLLFLDSDIGYDGDPCDLVVRHISLTNNGSRIVCGKYGCNKLSILSPLRAIAVGLDGNYVSIHASGLVPLIWGGCGWMLISRIFFRTKRFLFPLWCDSDIGLRPCPEDVGFCMSIPNDNKDKIILDADNLLRHI